MATMPAATLITVAPTGAESQKDANPALPVTLDELVVAARSCQDAGAAMVHIHIRDDEGRPTLDLGRLRDTVAAVRESTDLIVQLSTGGAVTDPFETRLAVLDAAPDSCSLTTGTVNFGDDIFANPWPFVAELYQRTQALGILPEFELFELGPRDGPEPPARHLRCAGRRARARRLRDGRARRDPRDRRRPRRRRGDAARRGHLVGHRDRAVQPARHARRPRRWAGTCASAWRTRSPTAPSAPRGTTPSWSNGPRVWPPRRSAPRPSPDEARRMLGLAAQG